MNLGSRGADHARDVSVADNAGISAYDSVITYSHHTCSCPSRRSSDCGLRPNMTTEADDGPMGWERRPFWGRLTPRRTRGIRPRPEARADELCHQCRFPWLLHPWRYDPAEDEMVRLCSAYPAEPVRSIEGCIAP